MERVDGAASTNQIPALDDRPDGEERAAWWAEDFPEGTPRRALDERMVSKDGLVRDEEAEQIEEEICLRFGASPEAATLIGNIPHSVCPRRVLAMARVEQSVVLTRLEPEDLVATLFDGLPLSEPRVTHDLAGEWVSRLRAFFVFVDRTLGLRHAKACVEVLDKGLTLALAHMLRAHEAWEAWDEVTEAELSGWEDGGAAPEGSRSGTMPAKPVDRSRKKARRRAQKARRKKNR